MGLPAFDKFMTPILRVLSNGQTLRRQQIIDRVADITRLTEQQRAEKLTSGDPVYRNRIGWGLSYLTSIKGVERPSRGHYRITSLGRELLTKYPEGLNDDIISKMPGYPESRSGRKNYARTKMWEPTTHKPQDTELSPTDQIDQGVNRINNALEQELLTRLHEQDPYFFEQAVLDLLMAMGYGGAEGKATRTPRSNDGGIDGIIDQDALGINRIYVQAKRYDPERTVGRQDLQAFVGALQGQNANHGLFITTARFTDNAVRYAENLSIRVILIDGARLARLMLKYHVGVQVQQTYEILEIDEDYFE